MNFHLNTQHFDCGDDTNHHPRAIGGAMAWLAFYAIAVVIVVVSNLNKAADVVVAAAN